MLVLGSTSFVISPNASKAFKILVVQRTKKVKSKDVTGREILTAGLYTIPLGFSFGNHCSDNPDDHAFEAIAKSADYDSVIRVWYLEKYNARGTATSHLHFPP